MSHFRLLFIPIFLATSLFAEATDKWKVEAGAMFVTTFDTDVQVSKKGFPVGAVVNTQDQLDLDNETVTYRLDGYYRFTPRHRIEGSYYGVRSTGNRVLDQDIEWNGNTIAANASTQSYFDMDIFKINYAYSFYHNDRVELALTAGLHITSISLGLQAQGTIDGSPNQFISKKNSVTAPLPIVGFEGKYTVIPNTLFVSYAAQYFYLEFEKYTGSLVTNTLAVEYRFTDHVGIGAGYDSTLINLNMDDGDSSLDVENTLAGFLLYLSYTY